MEMVLPLVLVLVFSLTSQIEAELQVGFYRDKCRAAESIVKDEVEKAFERDRGIAPGLLRLHFHDCFVRVNTCIDPHHQLLLSPYFIYHQVKKMQNITLIS